MPAFTVRSRGWIRTSTSRPRRILSCSIAAPSLEQELAELKRISASALELSESNLELTELNARLRAEVNELISSVNQLEDNAQQRWLMIGGGH